MIRRPASAPVQAAHGQADLRHRQRLPAAAQDRRRGRLSGPSSIGTRPPASDPRPSGLDYSGEYGFADTVMFWPITHMVAPADRALQCVDCHDESGGGRHGLGGLGLPRRSSGLWWPGGQGGPAVRRHRRVPRSAGRLTAPRRWSAVLPMAVLAALVAAVAIAGVNTSPLWAQDSAPSAAPVGLQAQDSVPGAPPATSRAEGPRSTHRRRLAVPPPGIRRQRRPPAVVGSHAGPGQRAMRPVSWLGRRRAGRAPRVRRLPAGAVDHRADGADHLAPAHVGIGHELGR